MLFYDPIKDIIESSCTLDAVNVTTKVIKKSPKVVGTNNLKLVETVIQDASGIIQLDVWEDHISAVEENKVYSFRKARSKELKKVLT